MKYKIMMVEDDPDIAELVSLHLEKYGFAVRLCRDFSDVVGEFEQVEPHLVLLDINLPAYDGFYWCGKIREKSSCPIIFLSSRNADSDQVYAMMNGGDDYVTKPFSLEVITAKITAILRRAYGEYGASAAADLRCGDCVFFSEPPDPAVRRQGSGAFQDGGGRGPDHVPKLSRRGESR